jgi:hypothetical protein
MSGFCRLPKKGLQIRPLDSVPLPRLATPMITCEHQRSLYEYVELLG